MKRIAISLMLVALASSTFAQKKNVSKAENALYEPVDLVAAKTSIEAAMTDPTTAKWEKTYYVAGNVYYKYYLEEEQKRMTNKPYDHKAKAEYLVKAIDAYAKAGEFGSLPDEKGKIKPKYAKEVKEYIGERGKYLINEGLESFNKKDYENATQIWGKYLEIPSYKIMAGSGFEKDSLYNEIKFYTVNAASNVASLKPKAIQYMEELKNAGYKEETMYEWLVGEYKEVNNTDKFLSTLQNGIKRFPKNQFLLGTMINYYISEKKENDAIAFLDEAIKADPKNAQYYAVKGNLQTKMENYDGAIATLNAALQAEPNSFDANANMASTYLNKAQKMLDDASLIKDNKKYIAAKNKAIAEFKSVIPYAEKARSLKKDDLQNLYVLRAAYLRTDQGDKYKAIDNEVKALENK